MPVYIYIYIYNDALCIILRQKLSVVMSLLRVKSHFTCGDPLIHLIIVIVTSLFCSWLTNRKGRVNPERAMEADNQKVENPQGEIPPQVARLLQLCRLRHLERSVQANHLDLSHQHYPLSLKDKPVQQPDQAQQLCLLPCKRKASSDYGVDVPARTCFMSFSKLRRVLRWHYVLLTLACFSSSQAEQVIDRIGIDAFNVYIVSIALRARHALLASMLQNINRLRSAAYQQIDNSIRGRLNAYNDVLIDPIMARIISMLKTTYINIGGDPSIMEFLPPYSANTTPPNELLADAAGAANWWHGFRVGFTWDPLNVAGAELNGNAVDNTVRLNYFGGAYGLPFPPGGIPNIALWDSISQRAQNTFIRDGIIEMERPAIKAMTSVSLAPFLRAYIRIGTLQEPLMVCIRGFFDPNEISNQTLADRMYLPLEVGVPNPPGTDACLVFERGAGWPAYATPVNPTIGYTYS